MIQHRYVVVRSVCYLCPSVSKLEYGQQILATFPSMSLKSVQRETACSMQPDDRTDGRILKKPIVTLSNCFAEVPKTVQRRSA
jgi:hypothetical protein